MPLKNGRLTPRERAFAQAFARSGDVSYSASRAGYRSAAGGSNALRRQPLQDRIAEIRNSRLAEALVVALDCLTEIAADRKMARRRRVYRQATKS